MKHSASLLIVVVVLFAANTIGVQAADVNVEPVLSGMNNPTGVVVQPHSGDVFVADSGAGQIVRLPAGSTSGKAEPVVTGFEKDVYGKGPMYDIGPLGLAFLDKVTLVVGDGSLKDGSELVRIYTLPEDGKPLSVDQAKTTLGPIAPSEDSPMGEGNFYGVAIGQHGIYFSSNGDDTKGWVLKADLAGGTPGALRPFIRTKELTGVDAPVGITISPRGELVVGQMGEINKPRDSLLTFYNWRNGKLLLNLETGLFDIAGLAYSPKSGRLYAVDFAWMETGEGGLFRLDSTLNDGKPSLRAEKITSLDKPTARAFAPDGTLYVTVFGTAKEGEEAKPGQLLKITGDL